VEIMSNEYKMIIRKPIGTRRVPKSGTDGRIMLK
jgi:hypothetical protein